MSELPEEPLHFTQDSVGLYLWSIADTLSLLPVNMRAMLVRGVESRLAQLTLRSAGYGWGRCGLHFVSYTKFFSLESKTQTPENLHHKLSTRLHPCIRPFSLI